ncbi:MAG: hypothetical protein JWN78_2025 [Bacteroidota bacterium]|nr:hypothetical protein [Bacteroidota bacterium]
MNTITNNVETFTSTELEEKIQLIKNELNNEHNEFLHTEVKSIATGYAQKNYPKEMDSMLPFLSKIRAFYLKLKSEVPLRISGQLQLLNGSLEIGKLDEHIKKCEEEKTALEKERWQLDNAFKRASNPINLDSLKWKKLSLWIIGAIDVVGYTASFINVMNDNYVFACVLGLSVGLEPYFLLKLQYLITEIIKINQS